MTAEELNAFLRQAFPHGAPPVVEVADASFVRCRTRFQESQIRPGDTVSGPTMMALADTAMYALVMAAIGLQPLAVTTNLSMNFLRRPGRVDLIGEARMLKLGKTLAVGDVAIRGDGASELCAHAVVTYALPPAHVRA